MPNINGTNGADTIDVTNDSGTLNSTPQGAPIDQVRGRNGDDTISVNNSSIANRVRGDGGNDTINVTGSTVTGRLQGDDGNDTINVTGSTVTGRLQGGGGDDTINVTGSTITGNLQGNGGDDEITALNSTLDGGLNSGDNDDDVTITGGTVNGNFQTSNGDDEIVISGSVLTGTLSAGNDADSASITGSSVANVRMGTGDDTLDFSSTSVSGDIRGNGGTDSLNLPAGTVVTDNNFGTFTVTAGNSYSLSAGTFTLPTSGTVTYTTFENGTGFPCFTQDTLIETEEGQVPVQDLQVGDQVETVRNGSQCIRWIGCRSFGVTDFAVNPKLRPVRITSGALGNGLPKRDMLVSRQHRMLVSSKIAQRMFGTSNVLVSAIKLTALPGIYVDQEVEQVTYFHLLFDRHEVIYAEEAPTESLFTGPGALRSVPSKTRAEILEIFPELADLSHLPKSAEALLSGKMEKRLIARHLKNQRPVLELFGVHTLQPGSENFKFSDRFL